MIRPIDANLRFGPVRVYGSVLMRSWVEAVLAVVVMVVVGGSLFLFTGESLGGEPSATTTPVTVDPEAATRGEEVANSTGCLACHTIDGTTGSGPTWKGLAGSSRPLEDGSVVPADDAYLHTSIVDPGAQVVAGFDNIMPTGYEDQLTEQEISDLVEYIKSLS